MLRKISKLLIVSCAFIGSCSTSTNSKPLSTTSVDSTTHVRENKPQATLVGDVEAKRWPHLKRHIGQLMLANGDTQLLLPAAPPLSVGQKYFALTSKVYRLTDKTWLPIPWMPSVEIRIDGKGSEAMQLVGQDIVQENGGVAIHAFFRQSNAGAADARLILQILQGQSRIDGKIVSSLPRLTWGLRVGRGLGEEHTIPLKGTQVAGITTSLLPHAFSLLGDYAFDYRQAEGFNYFEAIPGSPGFKLLLARDALIHQVNLLQSLMPCYQTPKAGCQGPLGTETWKLSTPVPSKSGERGFWQAAMFYDKQGSFRSLIPIQEGETLPLPLTKSERLELLYADGEGVLQKKTVPFKSQTVTLPPMKRGSLELRLSPNAPSFVEVKNAVQNQGKSLHAWVNQGDNHLMSPHTMLQSRWPFALPLPAGDYRVLVYNGYQTFCDQRVTILHDRKQSLDCSASAEGPSFSVKASISVDRAAITDAQIAATGIRIITSSESTASSPFLELPMVAAYDPELGLSMRAFPITPGTEAAWTQQIREKPERSSLQNFSEFIRTHDKQASLVLDCPPPGFQLSEYNWIVQHIRPDVLEVFGCQQPELSRDLLDIANRLQQKQPKAVRLAAASFSGSLYGSRVPSLYLPRFKREESLDSRAVLQDLQEGRYTLGFRAEMLIPRIRMADAYLPLVIRTADMRRRKVVVRVFDQDDPLSEETISLGENFESEVRVPLRLKSTSRWLRVELLAREKGAVEDGPLFTLATSNFFGLDTEP